LGDLRPIAGVQEVVEHNNATRLVLDHDTTPQDVLQALVAEGIALEKFEIAIPTLDEIFIRVVEEGDR
jgi:ABC-2 type transport system ATP-binding protein